MLLLAAICGGSRAGPDGDGVAWHARMVADRRAGDCVPRHEVEGRLRARLRGIAERTAGRLVRAYFEAGYRVLASPAGREFLRRAAAPGAPPVHGYTTPGDIEALVEALRPTEMDLLVDLGCGVGEVALAVHQKTGCRVIGVDGAPRAVAEARRRARLVGTAGAVRFRVGDLASPPSGGSGAYAMDSVMFVPRPPAVLAAAARLLEPPGRIFATFVDHRGADRDAFTRFIEGGGIEGGGIRIERLDDVTPAFREASRRRAASARRMILAEPTSPGRLGLLLVVAEEALVTRLLERGRLRRWRFTATAGSFGLPVLRDPPRSVP